MDIKISLALLAATAAALGFARGGCGIAPAAGAKTQLSFWNGFTGPDGRAMLRIIRRFNQENPDVQVSMQRMDWATYYNKLMVAAVDGRGPEVFVIHSSTLPRMVQAGFVADAKSLFEGANAIPLSDFEETTLSQVRYPFGLAGLPLDIHPQGLYFNKEMLREAGLSGPPKNKGEFERALRSLSKDLDADGRPKVWGFALTHWRNNFMSLLPQFGGRYLDEHGNADLDNDGNVAALEFLGSLSKQGLIPPPETGLGWVGYRQNKVAMVFEGVYMLGDLKRLQNLPYGGAPLPQIGRKPGSMADSHVLCFRSGLAERERKAAERFFKYLSDNSIEWASAGQVPARISIRELPEFRSMPVQYAFSLQVPYVVYPPRTTVLFELSLELDVAVEKVIRGRATAREALAIADQNAQRFIERSRRERGSAR